MREHCKAGRSDKQQQQQASPNLGLKTLGGDPRSDSVHVYTLVNGNLVGTWATVPTSRPLLRGFGFLGKEGRFLVVAQREYGAGFTVDVGDTDKDKRDPSCRRTLFRRSGVRDSSLRILQNGASLLLTLTNKDLHCLHCLQINCVKSDKENKQICVVT